MGEFGFMAVVEACARSTLISSALPELSVKPHLSRDPEVVSSHDMPRPLVLGFENCRVDAG